MSVPTLSLGCHTSEHQDELTVYNEVLKSYWNRCLTKSNQKCNDSSEICCYLMLIAKILNEEQFVATTMEPNYHILFETAIEMDMFHEMHRLLAKFHGTDLEALKESILLFYDVLMSCPHYKLFLKEDFLVPMMCSLNFCSHHSPPRIENILMQTLHTICVALRQYIQSSSPSKLELFWSVCLNPSQHINRLHSENSDEVIRSPTRSMPQHSVDEMHSLCDLLVNYVHRDGSLCWLSRDSLLLLAASSASNESAGYHIASDSNLCEVLATDMVVLFTNLPRQLVDSNSIDDWPKLLSGIEDQMLKDHPLEKFLDHYEFCCSIMEVSNYIVKENMLACLYKGFLIPVLASEMQSTSKSELATATMYLDRILLKSKESILLPFILRFLFSDYNATHSDGLTPQSFKHEITQVLEQSFPLSESSFLHGSSVFASALNGNSYMDLFLRRIEASNTLVGIATLSLMNTILDLLCEDVMFELILKYLLLGPHTELRKTITNPSSFISSAGQYLALIPPYSSLSVKLTDAPEASGWEGDQSGDLSLINLGLTEYQRIRKNRMQSCLLEARKLIAERKAACGDWRFSYDLGNPPPSIIPSAHMNENLLVPLPQEGLQNADEYSATVNPSDKVLTNSDRNQWELDGLTQMTTEDDSILADLERFSALLREPTVSTPFYSRKATTQNPKNSSGIKFRRHRQKKKEETTDLEDIKRTSSLYDITFVDMDPDENTESADLPLHAQTDRMAQSALLRRTSTSSTYSTTSQRSVELSLTESSEQLPLGVEEIIKKGGVPDLLLYLDRIPGGDYVDGKAVESRFETCVRQFDEKNLDGKVVCGGGDLKGRDALKGIDSVFVSVDSALMKTSSTAVESSSIEAASFYPGPYLTAILKLVNNIPSNHLYTNLQVTRLVSHLMALPLSIMRLQLLPLSLQETRSPNVHRRLYTTLTAVRQRFDCYVNLYFPAALSSSTDGAVTFATLVGGLREIVFSQRMEQVKFHTHRASVVESPKRLSWLLSHLRLNSLTGAPTPSSSSHFQSSKGSSPIKADNKINYGHEWRTLAMNHLGGLASSLSSNLVPLKSVKDEKSRGILMALFVFEEFCRELSALCLEHSVEL